jgi:DNA-binding MarR family transcriptional regulator
VLVTLTLSPEGSRRLSYLTRYLMVHQTTITQVVDQLEKRGLVRREPHPTDRRATLAVLTPAGRALCGAATAALAEAGFGMAGVDRGTLRTLIESLREARCAVGDL